MTYTTEELFFLINGAIAVFDENTGITIRSQENAMLKAWQYIDAYVDNPKQHAKAIELFNLRIQGL